MAKIADLDLMQRGRRFVSGAVMIVLGAVIGFALPRSSATPTSITGTIISVGGNSGSAAAGAGTKFVVETAKGKQGYQFQAPTPWQEKQSGPWRTTGQPTCLVPGSTTAVKVTIGVVKVNSTHSAPGAQLVAWIECYS